MKPQNQYFKVSADWMQKAGRGDVAQAFEVLAIERNNDQPEFDVLWLKTGAAPWGVFRIRGHMVAPWTLLLNHGRFEAFGVAHDVPAGAHHFEFHQFDTQEEARAAAAELNEALHVVQAAEIRTAAIESVRKGAEVRRLYRNGLPMLKWYTVDAYDKESDKYALLDGKGGVYWLARGKLVSLD